MHEEQSNASVKAVRSNRQEADSSNPEEKEKLCRFTQYMYRMKTTSNKLIINIL